MSFSLQGFLHDFPQWLKAALKAAHMTQTDLWRATGIPKGHISNIVNGKVSPSIRIVARIVDALIEKLAENEGENA